MKSTFFALYGPFLEEAYEPLVVLIEILPLGIIGERLEVQVPRDGSGIDANMFTEVMKLLGQPEKIG